MSRSRLQAIVRVAQASRLQFSAMQARTPALRPIDRRKERVFIRVRFQNAKIALAPSRSGLRPDEWNRMSHRVFLRRSLSGRRPDLPNGPSTGAIWAEARASSL